MVRVCRNRYIVCMVFLWLCGTSYSQVPKEVFIQKALDSTAKIRLENLTLEEVLQEIGTRLGVVLHPEASAMAQLPGGQLLQIDSVQLEGMPWREALREFLCQLGLTYQVGADRIYILGTPELIRHPRRLNRSELNALVALQTVRLNDSETKLLNQLRELLKIRFELIEFGRWEEKADKDVAEDILTKHPLTAVEVLDRYSTKRGREKSKPVRDTTWYLREETDNGRGSTIYIEILPSEKLLSMKLDHRITVSYRNQPVQTIFLDLARHSNLELRFEPGCLSLLDPQIRNSTSLEMQEATIQRAFDVLVGMTGLEYEVQADHIRIQAGATLVEMAKNRQPTASSSRTNPAMTVITIKIPGTDMEAMMFVRKEDLEEMGLQEKFQRYYLDSVKAYFDFLQNYEPTP